MYITAIELSGASDHSHISRVQWLQEQNGTAGTSSVPAFVEWLEAAASRRAHVAGKGGPSKVGVIRPRDGGSPYLRTYADGEWNNNLLALPLIR